MGESSRIMVNTMASYARLLVLALSGIFVSPIALHAMGAVDYGIFSVIGGSLAFLTFINIALTVSAQRHMAYALGSQGEKEVRQWLTTSVVVHVILAAAIAAVGLAFEPWVLHHLLVIPASRLHIATWVYLLVVASMVCNIGSTPYQALLVAHESIVAVSLLNILSATMMVCGVLLLPHLPGDALLWYGTIYCSSQIALLTGQALFCVYRYPESRSLSAKNVERQKVSELLSFSGWNLFGALSVVIRGQGPALLLNRFFGPTLNASYGLANQVNAFAEGVSGGILRSAGPPIVKRYASGDKPGMTSLSNGASFFSLVIMWIVLAPVLFDCHYCLQLWLHTIPPSTVAFVRLLLVALLIDQLTSGYALLMQATGRIAVYQVIVGGTNCLVVPIGYVMLRMGMAPASVRVATVIVSILACCGRLWIGAVQVKVPVGAWWSQVFAPAAGCIAACSAAILTLMHILPEGFGRFAAIVFANLAIAPPLVWKFGLTPGQRDELRGQVTRIIRSISPEGLRQRS